MLACVLGMALSVFVYFLFFCVCVLPFFGCFRVFFFVCVCWMGRVCGCLNGFYYIIKFINDSRRFVLSLFCLFALARAFVTWVCPCISKIESYVFACLCFPMPSNIFTNFPYVFVSSGVLVCVCVSSFTSLCLRTALGNRTENVNTEPVIYS